ncbi:uncharacterized protein [Nicotiana tomentosiformis]|uniref:uncharacterized protein n=1 Tax=Nicotiana tomentosiformis TaxID=4098 RepID=UPI00051BFD5A|nr:uncharacterized protein LOC104086814 [Nicotiana tomentosiformis]
MHVLSMKCKRQRRRNVRLSEVGDIPAACGISNINKRNFGNQKWKTKCKDSENSHVLALPQQMSKSVSDLASCDNINNAILCLGTKFRVMKRQKKSTCKTKVGSLNKKPRKGSKKEVLNDKTKGYNSNPNSVRKWLEELGFKKYGLLFEKHEVDDETLPLLTFNDLKEMGISAVGSRRKLFNAIQELKERREG